MPCYKHTLDIFTADETYAEISNDQISSAVKCSRPDVNAWRHRVGGTPEGGRLQISAVACAPRIKETLTYTEGQAYGEG